MLDVTQLIIGDDPQLARTTANTKPRTRARFLYFSAKTLNLRFVFSSKNKEPRAHDRFLYFSTKTLNLRFAFSSKNKEPRHGRGLVLDVTQGGFEPPTLRAEI